MQAVQTWTMWAGATFSGLAVITSLASSYIGSQVSNRQDREKAIAIAEAKTEAVSATATGEQAKRDAAVANEKAAKANVRAAQLSLKADRIESKNLELAKALEDEKIERIKLQASVAWRSLTPKQIVDLRLLAGRLKLEPITLEVIGGDAEAEVFCNQIAAALRAGGARVSDVINFSLGGTVPIGIFVGGPNPVPLLSVLRDSGLPAEYIKMSPPRAMTVLFVAAKPAVSNSNSSTP